MFHDADNYELVRIEDQEAGCVGKSGTDIRRICRSRSVRRAAISLVLVISHIRRRCELGKRTHTGNPAGCIPVIDSGCIGRCQIHSSQLRKIEHSRIGHRCADCCGCRNAVKDDFVLLIQCTCCRIGIRSVGSIGPAS